MSESAMMIPAQGMCLVCRVVLDPGAQCDLDPKHPVAELHTEGGRERALSTLWGPPSARAQARQLGRAGASGGVAGGMAEALGHGCGGCGELAGAGELGAVIAVIVAIVAVALSAVILVWLIGRAVTAWQRRKHRLKPLGAPRVPPERRGAFLEGVVEAKSSLRSWTGEEPCTAWGLEVLADDHRIGAVMLRDGRTAAFTLLTDDGRRVEVPAGRARVWSVEKSSDGRETVKGDALRSMLGGLSEAEDEYDVLVPADRAECVLVRPGDRVRLVGALEALPSTDGGYRDGSSSFRPVGVPRIARVG